MALPSPIPPPYLSLPVSSRCSFHIRLSAPLSVRTSLDVPLLSTRKPIQHRPNSLRYDRVLTSRELGEESDESSIGNGFFDAIEELEKMTRDPSDVLCEMVDRLSARDLQLVLVYFAQEGRDSYCALEVFDWLMKENKVDGETMELMVSIACGWIGRLIGEDCQVEDVIRLMDEIDCVGLEPGFSMVEKVVSMYWDKEKEGEAIEFVKFVMKRGRMIAGGHGLKGSPVGYLAWKMMIDGKYLDAVKVVIEFKEYDLKPDLYSYLIALTALVKEQKEFSKSLRKLKGSIKAGIISELDEENLPLIEAYQSNLLEHGTLLSRWALQEGDLNVQGLIHERLLALYTCAGCGLEAEHQLWQMKLCGKEPDRELYDIVLAICASQNEVGAVSRLLAGVDTMSAGLKRKTLLWLLRGYVKGGYYTKAAETLTKMLDLGLCPDYLDRAAVLQGLRKNNFQGSGNAETYLNFCKKLSDMDLIGPCLVYLHIKSHKLWVMKML